MVVARRDGELGSPSSQQLDIESASGCHPAVVPIVLRISPQPGQPTQAQRPSWSAVHAVFLPPHAPPPATSLSLNVECWNPAPAGAHHC